jgi:predicted ester cyclase
MKNSLRALLLLSCSYLFVACNNNPQKAQVAESATPAATTVDSSAKKAERNKATALASMEAFNARNVDGVVKDFSDKVTDHGDGSVTMVTSRDSIKIMINQYLKAFPDAKGENLSAMTDGNKVAVFATWTGKFTSEFMGKKPTGKSYKFDDVDIYTFNDEGKIIEHRSIQSPKLMWIQLGVTTK